jgi:hypothetical protein
MLCSNKGSGNAPQCYIGTSYILQNRKKCDMILVVKELG